MMRAALLLLVVSACGPPTPSIDAFRKDPAAAERMVADCEAGRASGHRCDNAAAGLAKARRDANVKAFREGFE